MVSFHFFLHEVCKYEYFSEYLMRDCTYHVPQEPEVTKTDCTYVSKEPEDCT